MKALEIHAPRAYAHNKSISNKVKPVSNQFFHYAIITWAIFVATLIVVTLPVSIVVLLIRRIWGGRK